VKTQLFAFMLGMISQEFICKKLFRKHVREAVGCQGLFKMLKGFEDKGGRAECRIGLAVPRKEIKIFVGSKEGKIVEPRGTGGFGWDSVFEPEGFNETYAEMSPECKDLVSDRAQAVRLIVEFLEKCPEWIGVESEN